MARHRIEQDAGAVVIELTEVGGMQEELLEAFGECQAGRCSCPTDEYEKLAAMEVQSDEERITILLRVKPEKVLDPSEITACLDRSVSKIDGER
jgi:hypothetical protein